MACCSKHNDDEEPQGMNNDKRGCTDILYLLVFGLFWCGMLVVGYDALVNGDPARMIYGLDSYGNYCGSLNVRDDGARIIDLRNATKLLYTNPLELLDPTNFQFANSVCVEECPSAETVCNMTDLPCVQNSQYVCPYYSYSQFASNGTDALNITERKGAAATDWWKDLSRYTGVGCVDQVFLESVPPEISNIMNTTSGCGAYYQTTSMYPGEGPCSAVYFETVEFMHRCYPVIPQEARESIAAVGSSGLASVSQDEIKKVVDRISQLSDSGLNTYITDAQRGFAVILTSGLGAALLLCLMYMLVLRFFAGFMAWTVVALVNVLFIVITVLAAYKSGLLSTIPGTEKLSAVLEATGGELTGNYKKGVEWMTYVSAVLTGVCVLTTLLMIRRIKIAIACIRVAANAIGSTPSIIFFPIITFISFVGLFVYWVIVFAHQWSAGVITETYRADTTTTSSKYSLTGLYESATANVTMPTFSGASSNTSDVSLPCYDDPDCYYSIEFTQRQQVAPTPANNDQELDRLQHMFLYHLFGLLWTNQFIIGFGYVVIAHCIGQYYWTRGIRKDMTTFPVLTGIWVAARFHMGSIAFGAFIVAVIQFVRLLLEYMDRKTKKMQKGNPAARWIMCCVRCCLWYLEKIMKFINRNAYILVAVKGKSYCGAAMRAIKLVVLNVGRLAAVNVIGDALIFLGKITIVLASGSIAFLMTDLPAFSQPDSEYYLSSPVVPVILSLLAAYMVASIFFSVYEMAIDTILLSFCEDCTANNEMPQFAPKLLMSALGKAKKFQEQQDKRASNKTAAVVHAKDLADGRCDLRHSHEKSKVSGRANNTT